MQQRTKTTIYKKFLATSNLKTNAILSKFNNISNKTSSSDNKNVENNKIDSSIGVKHAMNYEEGDQIRRTEVFSQVNVTGGIFDRGFISKDIENN